MSWIGDEVKTLKNETSLRGWVALTLMLCIGAYAIYDVFTHPPKKAEVKVETVLPAESEADK